MAPKITFIGAGSIGFTRKLIFDLMAVPELQKAELVLMDIDPQNLGRTEQLVVRDLEHNGLPKSMLTKDSEWIQKNVHGDPVSKPRFCCHHPDVRQLGFRCQRQGCPAGADGLELGSGWRALDGTLVDGVGVATDDPGGEIVSLPGCEVPENQRILAKESRYCTQIV